MKSHASFRHLGNPIYDIKDFRRRTVPHGGFAAVQDDIVTRILAPLRGWTAEGGCPHMDWEARRLLHSRRGRRRYAGEYTPGERIGTD